MCLPGTHSHGHVCRVVTTSKPRHTLAFEQPELDYMSRLILTTVDLTSDKFIARDLLNTWMTSGSRYAIAEATQFLLMFVVQV